MSSQEPIRLATPTTKRVLVVDVFGDFAFRAALALNRHGFDARAHNGPFGTLAIVHRWRPHIAVLGALMPGLSGEALADILREAVPTTAIVLCSQFSGTSARRIGKAAGLEVVDAEDFFVAQLPKIVAAFGKAVAEQEDRSRADNAHAEGHHQDDGGGVPSKRLPR